MLMYVMTCNCHLKQLCNSSSTFNINKFFVLCLRHFTLSWGFPGGPVIKNPPAHVRGAGGMGSLSGSGILAWRIPWTEKPGGL